MNEPLDETSRQVAHATVDGLVLTVETLVPRRVGRVLAARTKREAR